MHAPTAGNRSHPQAMVGSLARSEGLSRFIPSRLQQTSFSPQYSLATGTRKRTTQFYSPSLPHSGSGLFNFIRNQAFRLHSMAGCYYFLGQNANFSSDCAAGVSSTLTGETPAERRHSWKLLSSAWFLPGHYVVRRR